MEAVRNLKRLIFDAVYRQLVADAQRTEFSASPETLGTGPRGQCGADSTSSAPTPGV